MNNIVIIGATVSGHNIALRLREKDKDCHITLISEENYLPYDHFKLADLISGIVPENNIFLCSEDFYQQQNINFLKGKKVGSLNTQKKLLYFKDKGNLSYDLLVIASGRSPTLPDIPGARKVGAYRLYTLDDTKEFLKSYISEPVCIAGGNSFALRIAEAIAEKYGVEVKFLTRKVFDPSLTPKYVEIINDAAAEVIGEGQIQAVKLASGKVISACVVLFIDDYKSNIDFLKNTDVRVENDIIVVDGFLRTTVKDIFACGSVVAKDNVTISMMLVDHIISQMKGERCQTS